MKDFFFLHINAILLIGCGKVIYYQYAKSRSTTEKIASDSGGERLLYFQLSRTEACPDSEKQRVRRKTNPILTPVTKFFVCLERAPFFLQSCRCFHEFQPLLQRKFNTPRPFSSLSQKQQLLYVKAKKKQKKSSPNKQSFQATMPLKISDFPIPSSQHLRLSLSLSSMVLLGSPIIPFFCFP